MAIRILLQVRSTIHIQIPISQYTVDAQTYIFSDTVGARALPHNAVDLHPGLPRGNLTVAACVTACQASGK